jgi:hypothetical protein
MSAIKLFRLANGHATELQGAASGLERRLQILIENNLAPLLGIRFLASEHTGAQQRGHTRHVRPRTSDWRGTRRHPAPGPLAPVLRHAVLAGLCLSLLPLSGKAATPCLVRISAILRPASDEAKTLNAIVELEKQQQAMLDQLRQQHASMPPSPVRDTIQDQLKQIDDTIYRDKDGQTSLPTCPLGNQPVARYLREIIARIEDCGTHFFPKANGKQRYGAGKVAFTLDRAGQVIEKHIEKSSGDARIDQYLLTMVMQSAPFGQVPFGLHDGRFDQFIISSRFETKNETGNEGISKPRKSCYPTKA